MLCIFLLFFCFHNSFRSFILIFFARVYLYDTHQYHGHYSVLAIFVTLILDCSLNFFASKMQCWYYSCDLVYWDCISWNILDLKALPFEQQFVGSYSPPTTLFASSFNQITMYGQLKFHCVPCVLQCSTIPLNLIETMFVYTPKICTFYLLFWVYLHKFISQKFSAEYT